MSTLNRIKNRGRSFFRAIALVSFALLPALFFPMAHAQVIVQGDGQQQFCGNWGSDGGNTCMGLSGQLYKDDTEQDPHNDFYMLIVRAWDPTNDGYGIGDMWVETYTGVSVSGGAIQPAQVDSWQPQAGSVPAQTQITFSYAGISVPIYIPADQIDISPNYNDYGWLYVPWHVYNTCNCPPAPMPNPGYAEMGLAFQVPENGQVNINVYLHVRFVNPPLDNPQLGYSWGSWTPTYGQSYQYPPTPPPPRCPPVC